MREGVFPKLGSQPWRHVLAARSRSQASVRVAALLDVQMMMSAR